MDLKIEGKLDGTTEIRIVSEDSVKLTRGQKGAYGWEIKVYSTSATLALERVIGTDTKLRKNYGGVDDGNTTNPDVA